MLNSIATGFAPPPSVPTAVSAASALATATAAVAHPTGGARLHRQLLELQLPEFLFGDCLSGHKC